MAETGVHAAVPRRLAPLVEGPICVSRGALGPCMCMCRGRVSCSVSWQFFS